MTAWNYSINNFMHCVQYNCEMYESHHGKSTYNLSFASSMLLKAATNYVYDCWLRHKVWCVNIEQSIAMAYESIQMWRNSTSFSNRNGLKYFSVREYVKSVMCSRVARIYIEIGSLSARPKSYIVTSDVWAMWKSIRLSHSHKMKVEIYIESEYVWACICYMI